MARDHGLEELVREDLGDQAGLSETPMFGGLAWLLHGHLLCAGGGMGLLVRLGKGQDDWALAYDGVEPMVMQKRAMSGWVRVSEDAYGDDDLRRRLLDQALAFVRALPPKSPD